MLRRNSSKRLEQRKSTSSANSKLDSIDPVIARQHAHTAATLAFHRAQDRSSIDAALIGNGNLRDPTNSQNCQSRNLGARESQPNTGDRTIRRQQSVRFVGSNGGVERRQSIGIRALNNPIPPKATTAALKPVAMTTNAPVPAVYRPPSRSSSLGKASGGRTESFLTASAYDEYYARGEEELTATPSSYRRIRRSKSMYSPRHGPNVYFTNGTPCRPESSYNGTRTPFSTSQTSQNGSLNPALRAPKSMTFLRGIRGQINQERNDNAVQHARDRFFQEAEQQRLRAQPSFIFRSNAQKQERPFRKSVRSSSGQSGGAIVSSTQSQQSRESSLREVARKATTTIKNKLRRVFGRTKDDPVAIPNQQVEAKGTHIPQYHGDEHIIDDAITNIPHPDQAALTRVASRVPSLHAVPSSQQLRSHAGSVKSFKSDHSDDKSRVTSWQSTGANTITTIATKALTEKDQQRLSIINEVGTHVPSSSFSRKGLTNQFSAYPVVHRPSKSSEIPISAVPIDSARVYSALMKRLDENSPQAKLEASRKASLDNCSSPTRSNSNKFIQDGRRKLNLTTIRQVIPSETLQRSESDDSSRHAHQWVGSDEVHSARAEETFGYTGTHVHQWQEVDSLRKARMHDEDDVFSPRDGNSSDKENIPPNEQKCKKNFIALAPPVFYDDGRNAATASSDDPGLTPQDIAVRNEPVIPSRTLRETKSTFFGGGSVTVQRTQSPFRRVMAEIELKPPEVTNDIYVPAQLPLVRNPLYFALSKEEKQSREDSYSESVYSRTTSGQVPILEDSKVSLPVQQEEMPASRITGDVLILNQTTYRPTMPNSGSGHRTNNSAGSVEWKKWMSSEVAKLERSKENTRTATYVNYALPTMPKSFHSGHIREAAQINDDEVEVSQRKVSISMQPLGLVQQQNPNIQGPAPLKPILKNRSTVSLVEDTEPIYSISSIPKIPIPPPPPPPPPPLIPNRSPLRATQSKSSIQSVGGPSAIKANSAPNSATRAAGVSGRNVLHKRNVSQSTLHSVKSLNASIKSVETPAKLVKRDRRPSTASRSRPTSGLSNTVESQFGSTSTISRYKTPGSPKGNVKFGQEDDIYGIDGTGLMGPRASIAEMDAQAIGSQKMVEMFLSSRRKRIVTPSDEAGSMFL